MMPKQTGMHLPESVLRAGGLGCFRGFPRQAPLAVAGGVTIDELQVAIPSAQKAVNDRRQLARCSAEIVSIFEDRDRSVRATSYMISAGDRADRGAACE